MIQSCINYGFASPHALAVAIDSLYGAYLKVNYPYEYYTVCFNHYANNMDKIKKLTSELGYFGIKLESIVFRKSSDKYMMDKDTKSIYKGISSVKFMNEVVSQQLYELRYEKFSDFFDFLEVNPCNSRQLEILIRLNFFREFGAPSELLRCVEIYDLYGKKKQIKKDRAIIHPEIYERYCTSTAKIYKIVDRLGLMRALIKTMPVEKEKLSDLLGAQNEFFGYIDYIDKSKKNMLFVMKVDTKYSPRIEAYSLAKGNIITLKIKKTLYNKDKIVEGDIIRIEEFERKNKLKFKDGDYVPVPNEYDWWAKKYVKVNNI